MNGIGLAEEQTVKILLVDDSTTMRNIQKKVLSALPGAEFAEAGDGVEALDVIAASGKFDLIVIDWNMPNMDGYTLVGKIRSNDGNTPLIMCTTEAEKQRVMDAIKAGVNNFVIKPFTPDMLMEKVKQTLDRCSKAAAA
jgi:two-component system, chemotaxis family, chemotaxis protein CheY